MKILAWLGFIALTACSSDATPHVEGAIEGVVRDEFTQDGISGAEVHFVSDTLDEADAVTDENGSFTLRVEMAAGVRFGMLSASRAGYAESKQQSVYFDGATLRAELLLRPKN